MILEEEKRDTMAGSSADENAETASGGVNKFKMIRGNGDGERSRSRSPPVFYCKRTYHRFNGQSMLLPTTGKKVIP